MTTFDAPDRETCQVRRARTNTPLQALVMMNDIQFVEAARKLAERIMHEGGEDTAAKSTFAFRTILTRMPSEIEQQTLASTYAACLKEFQESEGSADAFLKTGESARDASLDVNELAAWTMVAHLIFNLSESVTRG